MNPYARSNVYFNCYRYSIDSDAFCTMDVYQHVFFSPNVISMIGKVLKKEKNVAKS